ncbi:UNKNOWN [Stylonychia lemnae]|uniref:Uncharacterized protein n=1 Tax=Stylonychia lemnae TaxID=5949 RepID=A0A078AC98_STYLE|nr:UNKNOWN [Stylonychia lemnae]|eukprot:CDW79875.1 UNKNOWN [Stylonychia lemnae]
MESAKKVGNLINQVTGLIGITPSKNQNCCGKQKQRQWDQPIDNTKSFRKDFDLRNDFYLQHANPQVQQIMAERDIPQSKKRSYQQIDQFEFIGGDMDSRRILRPTIKSDFEDHRQPSNYQPTTFDKLLSLKNISCPSLSLNCGTKACKVLSVASSNDDNQTQATANENENIYQSTEYQQSVLQQLKSSQILTQQRSKSTDNFDQAYLDDNKQENSIIALKKYLKQQEDLKFHIKVGLERLWHQIDEDFRGKEKILNKQGLSLNKLSFYELQPHIIYSENNRRIIPLGQDQNQEYNDAGFLHQLNLGYIIVKDNIIFWQLNHGGARDNQITITIDHNRYGTILGVSNIRSQCDNQHFVVVVTELEILLYQFNKEQLNKFTLLHKNKDDPIYNDHHQNTIIYQSINTDRVFIGSVTSQVNELKISTSQNQKRASFISCLVSSNNKINKGNKFSMINQSSSNAISKFFGKILQSQNLSQQVKGFAEHIESNTLFQFVDDQSNKLASYIQITDLGRFGDDFKNLFQISLEKIFTEICQTLNMNIDLNILRNVEIHKIHIHRNNLLLIFENGFKITIELMFQDIQNLNQDDDFQVTSLACSKLQIINSWKVEGIQQIPLARLIDQYQSLFQSIEQKDMSYRWKPFVADPIYLCNENQFSNDSRLKIIDSKFIGEKEFYLVRQTYQDIDDDNLNKEYQSDFLMSIQPNYRREGNLKNTQHLVGIKQINECAIALNVFSKENIGKRASLDVLTDQGIIHMIEPNDYDVISSYLEQILKLERNKRDIKSHLIIEVIQRDLQIYLQGQSLMYSLKNLLEIITSGDQDQFVSNDFAEYYYKNIQKCFGNDCTDLDSALKVLKTNSFMGYLNNYASCDKFSYKQMEQEIQQRAFEIFLEITDSSLEFEFDSIIQSDEQYQIFWNNLKTNNETSILNQKYQYVVHENAKQLEKPEYFRVNCMYKFLYNQIQDFLQEPIFKFEYDFKTQKQKCNPNISRDLMKKAEIKLAQLKKFIIAHKQNIQIIHDDQMVDHLSLYEELECFSRLLDRFIDGMQYLSNLITWEKLDETIKSIESKAEQMSLADIEFFEFIEKGLTGTQIGFLIERYITWQFSSSDIMNYEGDKSIIKGKSNSFVDESVLNLIFGRKLLQEALATQNQLIKSSKNKYQMINNSKPAQVEGKQDVSKMKRIGFNLLMRCSRQLNLPVALLELMKNEMIEQSIALCVNRFDQLAIYIKVLNEGQESDMIKDSDQIDNVKSPLKRSLNSQKISLIHQDQQECMIIIQEIIEELIQRQKQMEQQQKIKKSKNSNQDVYEIIEVSKYDAIKVLVRNLQKIQNLDDLDDLKQKVYKECIKSTSFIFHQDLYEKLMELQQLQDIMKFETPFAKDYLERINQEIDENKPSEAMLTLQQRSQLHDQKIQATFQYMNANQLFGEAYLFIMEQTCNTDTILDLKLRISWISKGEGCLQKYKDDLKILMMENDDQRNISKLDIKINDSQRMQNETFKDYFLQVLQIRDGIKRKLEKINIKKEEDVTDDILQIEVIVDRLTYQVLDVNEVYQLAIQFKRWQEYLDILRLTELRDNCIKDNDTQKRINFLYQALIDHYYKIEDLKAKPKKYQNFITILTQLSKSSLTFESAEFLEQIIELFPMKLLLEQIDNMNMSYLEQTRDGKYLKVLNDFIFANSKVENLKIFQSKWSPFWHVEFFNSINSQKTYDILIKLKSFLPKHQMTHSSRLLSQSLISPKQQTEEIEIPEKYLSISILAILWAAQKLIQQNRFNYKSNIGIAVADLHLKKVEVQSVLISLKLTITDELLYSKQYADEIKAIIKNLEDALIKL